MSAKCDIIIPVWNQLAFTKDCVDSISANTDSADYRLIFIDNASDAPAKEYLENLKGSSAAEVSVVRNGQNTGFVKAANQGMRMSVAPYVCIMNNDTIATNGWIKEMVSVMESDPAVGIVNPSSNTSGQFPEPGESIENYAMRLKQYAGHFQELYTCR